MRRTISSPASTPLDRVTSRCGRCQPMSCSSPWAGRMARSAISNRSASSRESPAAITVVAPARRSHLGDRGRLRQRRRHAVEPAPLQRDAPAAVRAPPAQAAEARRAATSAGRRRRRRTGRRRAAGRHAVALRRRPQRVHHLVQRAARARQRRSHRHRPSPRRSARPPAGARRSPRRRSAVAVRAPVRTSAPAGPAAGPARTGRAYGSSRAPRRPAGRARGAGLPRPACSTSGARRADLRDHESRSQQVVVRQTQRAGRVQQGAVEVAASGRAEHGAPEVTPDARRHLP